MHRTRRRIRAVSSVLSTPAPARGTSRPPSAARQRHPDQLRQSGTRSPHSCIRGCQRHPPPPRDPDSRRFALAPDGRRTPGCIGVDAKCTGLAEPRVTFRIGGPAGSMPAWTPVSLRTTDDSPLIRCESGSVGVGDTRGVLLADVRQGDGGGEANTQVVDPIPARVSGAAGGVAIVFGPCFGGATRAGVLRGSQLALVGCPRALGHSRLETGSGPILSGVGARIDPCSPGR